MFASCRHFPDLIYKFEMTVRDGHSNPRWGADRVRVALCEGLNPPYKLVKGFISGAGETASVAYSVLKALNVSKIGTAGVYEFEYRFNPKLEKAEMGALTKGFGNFVLQAFVCPSSAASSAASCGAPVASDAACNSAVVGEQRITTYLDVPADAEPCPNLDGQVTCPSSTVKKPTPVLFTLCPANSFTSSGDWNGAKGTGFVSGHMLTTCQCNSGYTGTTGSYCSACPEGKFKGGTGNTLCSDCLEGKYSRCNNVGDPSKCGPNNEPANIECTLCPATQYQNSKGATECDRCLPGYECASQGMTYPIAIKGYWISPTDPTILSVCQWGEDACPGGNRANETTLRNTGNPCTTNDGGQENSISAACIPAVGARCNLGYEVVDGAGCDACCKRDTPPPPGSNCGDGETSYFQQGGMCQRCKGTSKTLTAVMIIVIIVVVGPVALKIADAFKHAGSLQAPLMSLINFFQSASLFRHLNLHWPEGFKAFVRQVAGLFMFQLPDLPFVIHPECAFHLTYPLRWSLAMASPFLLVMILALAGVLRIGACHVARVVLRRFQPAGSIEEPLVRMSNADVDRLEQTKKKRLSCSGGRLRKLLLLLLALLIMAAGLHFMYPRKFDLNAGRAPNLDIGIPLLAVGLSIVAAMVIRFFVNLCRSGAPRRFVQWLAYHDKEKTTLHGEYHFVPVHQLTTAITDKAEYLVLVYLMVAYIFIVSNALEPWSCVEDLHGIMHMKVSASQPMQQIWNVLQIVGPNHLGWMWVRPAPR